MRVTKIGPPVAVYRKALGYDPTVPDGDVEEPVFEGAFVLIPRDTDTGIQFVPAPTVTDGDLDTYAETSAHDEAMQITLDFAARFTEVRVLGAWETSTERTYTFEAANLPDFSDAVELASTTFTSPADWTPYEITFDYESLPTAYQYYRLIGPDEERRWHNLAMVQASVDGCECIELCRDSDPAAFVASNDTADLGQSDPVDLDAVPEPGDLWLIGSTAGSLTGFTAVETSITPGGQSTFTLLARAAEAGDDGTISAGGPIHWLTALFRGVDETPAVTELLDDQSNGGAGTIDVNVAVPSGEHLVVGYFVHDNTTPPSAGAGWTLAEAQSNATTKWHALVYKFSEGGTTETAALTVTGGGGWGVVAAAFPCVPTGEAIVGGPNATAGDGTKAAPCTHDHAYTTEHITHDGDPLDEVLDAITGGTPASTVESETTFGITPAVGTDTEYARQDHTHGTPPDPVTSPTHVWMPLTTRVGGVLTLVADGDAGGLIPTLVPLE